MKALILKDTYVIWRQMKYFLDRVMILLFSALPSGFNNAFAVIYTSMLPYTALAYDERSKWDQMAAMMPYSTRDIVISKYVLGWLCTAAAALFAMAVQLLQTVLGSPLAAFAPMDNLMGCCASLCVLAVTLPLMFRFGVEKGRLMMFLIIFLVCGSAGALSSIAVSVDHTAGGLSGPFAALMAVLPIAAAALTAVSVPLSMKFYARRQA